MMFLFLFLFFIQMIPDLVVGICQCVMGSDRCRNYWFGTWRFIT